MDPRSIHKERINTQEAHTELIFKKHLAEPTRLRKINDLIDTIRELEKQKIVHRQSPEYFKVMRELQRLGGTVRNNETDSDSGLTDFLSTDSSEAELDR